MATVTLRGGELDGALPDVCVMCGDDADVDVDMPLQHDRARLTGVETLDLSVDLPYCDRCWRRQKGSAFGGHKPRNVLVDGPPLSVRMSSVSDDFADPLDAQREKRRRRDDDRDARPGFARPVRRRERPTPSRRWRRVSDPGTRALPAALLGGIAVIFSALFVAGKFAGGGDQNPQPANNPLPGSQPAARFGPRQPGGPPVNPADPFGPARPWP